MLNNVPHVQKFPSGDICVNAQIHTQPSWNIAPFGILLSVFNRKFFSGAQCLILEFPNKIACLLGSGQ